ncbi:MAG: GNAT family N-acetyltransferase [Hyphomicrobiaceae bacterium]|nr:GNAT family N-acetyltransferase [Hyphomicrobiaceae bacterium]
MNEAERKGDRADVVIRRAERADVPALIRLLGILFTQEADFVPDADRQSAGLLLILDNPASGLILVADGGERGVVGSACLLFTVSTALGAPVAILEDVIVDPEWRGQGLGRRLVGAVIEAAGAAGCQRISLLTDHDNARAQALYQSFGFLASGMRLYRLLLGR